MSTTSLLLSPAPPRRHRTTQRSTNRRNRRLLLEGLEQRYLMAFDVAAEYATGSSPGDILLTQIDAGSQLDMVVLQSGGVSVRLGNADGTFGDALVTSVGTFSNSVVAGDFTGDGVTDLVTSSSPNVLLLIGNGNGTFQSPQAFGLPNQYSQSYTGYLPYAQAAGSIAVGDLNDDGNLDLAVGGITTFPSDIGCGYYSCGYIFSYEGFVNVLLGNGNGSFDYVDADPSEAYLDAFRTGVYQTPTTLAIEDLNNDGDLDVFVALYYGGVASLLGDGMGGLGTAIGSASGYSNPSAVLGDFDDDGFPDVASFSGTFLNTLTGQGDGQFIGSSSTNMDMHIHSVATGDINGDGVLDLVAVGQAFICENGTYYPGYGYYGCSATYYDKRIAVVLGNGEGGFSLPTTSLLATGSEYALFRDLALADLNDDGRLDLATNDLYAVVAIVALNDGNWSAPGEISISPVSVIEGHAGTTSALLTVTLIGEHDENVSVDYSTSEYYGYGAAPDEDYDAVSGTLVFAPGVFSKTITIPIHGDRRGEGDESFMVNLAHPQGALLRNHSAQVTILDDEPQVSINHSLYDDPLTVVEGDVGTTPAEFTVTLSAAYDQEVTVGYYTSTGHINDIIAASGTLTFAPGETVKTITVQIVNDLIHEYQEAFNVYLTNQSFNTYLGNSAGYCYIEDNDPLPTVSINDVSVTEGNSGTKTMTFTVTLSDLAQYEVGIDYATSDGTATTADKDYVARSGAVYIAAGNLTTTISITIRGDKTKEQDELFFVNLHSAGGAEIGDGRGVGTILNDDNQGKGKPAKVRISDAALIEGHTGPQVITFNVTLSESSETPVEVKYFTRNGTARVSNNDYQAASGTLTFAPSETTKTISIEIRGDKKKETDEYFYVLLSGAKGASLADNLGKGTIRNDDPVR